MQALNTGVHPLYYMFAGVIASSFAFMLPVATPPNALVFSYGRVRIIEMVRRASVMRRMIIRIKVETLDGNTDMYDDNDTMAKNHIRNIHSAPDKRLRLALTSPCNCGVVGFKKGLDLRRE